MKTGMAVLLALWLALSGPLPVLAKERTVKIIIKGAGLKAPIEITDPDVVAKFRVWAGRGTSSNDRHGLIVDWSQGPVTEAANAVRRYEVSFYTGTPPNEHLAYVVYYAFSADASPGYVYLPGDSDEWASLNVRSIFRGVEGKWFRAWSAWESVARPRIQKGS
jgi:hypothetical protein